MGATSSPEGQSPAPGRITDVRRHDAARAEQRDNHRSTFVKWYPGLGLAAFVIWAAPAAAQQLPVQEPDSAVVNTTRSLPRELIRNLPVDDATALLRFLPGFDALDGRASYRSRAFQLHSYVDGVPMRSATASLELQPPTGSLRSVSITGLDAPAWLRGRGVSYETETGAERLEGDARFGTDALAPTDWDRHLTRLELGARGPLPGIAGLSFSLDADLLGNRYRQLPRGYEGDVYLAVGLDTVIRVARTPGTDSVDIAIPTYQVASYDALPLGNSDRSDVVAALRFERGAGDWLLRYQRTSITGMERAIADLYNPDLWHGQDDAAHVISLSGRHALPLGLTFSGAVSHQRYDAARGVVDPAWANANASPTFGIMGGPELLAERDDYEVTDAMILALRSGVLPLEGMRLTTLDNPLAIRRQGVIGVQQSLRLNPYGMRSGWFTAGIGSSDTPAAATWTEERRWYGRAALDKQLGRFGFTVGGELDRTEAESFTLPWVDGLPSAMRQKPEAIAGFVDLRAELAGARIFAGVRAERFGTDALLPRVPGIVTFVPDSLTRDRYVLRPGAEPWQERLERLEDCGGAATAAARTNPVTGQPVCIDNFVTVADETAISPRIGAEYDLGGRFTARAGYAAYVQNPALYNDPYRDLSTTTTSASFAAAYRPVRENVIELGVTTRTTAHSFVDVLLFRHDAANPLTFRLREYEHPITGGSLFLRTVENGGASTTTGVELAARHVVADWLGVQGHVTYSSTKQELPEGAVGEADSRSEPLRAGAILAFEPGRIVQHGAAGTVLADLIVHVTGSYRGGARYTPLVNVGEGTLVGQLGEMIGGGVPSADNNSAQMPAWKQLDLRITKGFRVLGSRAAVFADLRNPLGIRNTRYIYAETGTTTNAIYEDRRMMELMLANTGTGDVRDMVIDEWTAENAVNRHLLHRAEQRFGNGDGIFTVAEMVRAWGAGLNLQQGSHLMTSRERELRLGIELQF
jgi:hypothetical protein